MAKAATTHYLNFSPTTVVTNNGPVNPTNGPTSIGGAGLAAGDLVIFDAIITDLKPGTQDAWGAVELNQRPGGFIGLTLSQLGVLARTTTVLTNVCQLWTNSAGPANFPVGATVNATNRVRIELTATVAGSTTNMSWVVKIDQGLTGAFTTTLSGNNVTFTNNNIGLTFSAYTDSYLFVDDSPPVINTQPASQTAASGNNVTLGVAAVGAAPLKYQWFKNGPILGATNNTLTVTNASMTNSGIYFVAVTNAYGLAISLPASLAVGSPQLLEWGYNGNGQLGDGTTSNRSLPESVATNVLVAAAGASHSLFVDTNGVLWARGYNGYGQLGDGTTIQRTNPVSVASNVVAVAAGQWHSLFLKSDGTMWAMGNNAFGQLGDGTTTERHSPVSVGSNVVAVAAGAFHSLFLKNNGSVWAMGYNAYGQLGDGSIINRSNAVSVASNVLAAVAGGYHSLFFKSDGSLWGVGWNAYGQLGDGTTNNRSLPESLATNVAVAMAAGFSSMFVKTNSTLWGMGWNSNGQLGNGTTNQQNSPVSVATNVLTVSAENFHTLFLKNDGTAWAMGDNTYSELGDGTTNQRTSPATVTNLSLASVISGDVDNYYTLAVGLPFPVITSQPTNQTVVATSNVTFAVTASGVGPLSYQWYFEGNAISGATATNYTIIGVMATNAGNYTVVVINPAGSVTSSVAILTVTKATGTVTLGNLNQTYNGSAESATASTTPSGLTVNLTYNGSVNAPTNAGSYTVIGTINNANYTGSATNTLVIAQAGATVTLGNLNQTYNGSAESATASTTPSGLTVNLTYNGSVNAPTNAGSYTVIGTINNANYTGSATNTLVIAQAGATVTLGNLNQTYSGSAEVATATTIPSGLAVNLTYNGSVNAPTNAGSYTVIGTINNANYTGSATNTLVIAQAGATVTLGNLSQTYSGSAEVATATTIPSGLAVNLTYNGSVNAPTNAGGYTVIGTINNVNYTGSATNTLVIAQAGATVTLGNLNQTYNGSAESATATTIPSGLTVNLTYNGSVNAPTNAGSYTVIGTINNANYTGSATNTLVISQASVSVLINSSANPCGYRDTITFTASLISTNATGTVQFATNGVAFDLETLTNGQAKSVGLSSLPRGTNLIAATYSGDSSYLSGANTFEQVVTNHPPQAVTATYTLTAVPSYKILITDLATNWSDADGDPITLVSVNTSTNGSAVSFGSKYIYYSDTNMVSDQFTYVISDGQGGTGIGIVNLLEPSIDTNRTLNITSITRNNDGSMTVGFAGIPGYTYWVEAATNLTVPAWEVISTNVAGSNGLWEITDTNAANYSMRFYRTYKP